MDDQEYKDIAEEAESKAWLTTYADMVTLLLTFFVMLLAISSMDTERFDNIINSIQYTLGANVSQGGRTGRIDMHEVRQQSLSQVTGDENEPLLQDIRQMVKKKNLEDAVSLVSQDGKVILRVKGQVLFGSASSQFNKKAKKVLNDIAQVIIDNPEYRLDVGGHTDSRPIHSTKYASNWELSALRATAVLRYLVSTGINPRRLTATGYAATDPLAPNTTKENLAKNRRVEFVLEKITR